MRGTPAVRRAIDALGIGPVWVRRDSSRPSAGAAPPPEVRATAIALLERPALESAVARCVACGLATTRRSTVFGVGPDRIECLVIGEAPGSDEDARGEPFVGQAGKLLDAMLAAIGLARTTNAFITNVLKCRPPGNRDPSPEEIAACRPFLERQIAILAPPLVLVVGRIASQTLLGSTASMSALRGREHRPTVAGREVPVFATYHPAYLLRSPEEKARAWADLCLVRAALDRIAAERAAESADAIGASPGSA